MLSFVGRLLDEFINERALLLVPLPLQIAQPCHCCITPDLVLKGDHQFLFLSYNLNLVAVFFANIEIRTFPITVQDNFAVNNVKLYFCDN
jgi:hypothetical protein